MGDIAAEMNYTNLYEIDVTPEAASPTWERIGVGINNVDWEGNEEVSQDPDYAGDGMATSDVTGGQLVGTFEGWRDYSDAAQNFVASLLVDYGSGRKTRLRWTAPDGQVIVGKVTVVNVKPQGGDPNAKMDFSFEIHFNGMPEFTPGDASEFPDSIAAEAVSVAVGASAPVGATVSPEGASPALVYASADRSVAEVGSDGTVRGIKEGETSITIKSAVKPMVTASVKVTVTAAAAKTQAARTAKS